MNSGSPHSFPHLNDEAFLQHVYLNLLGRTADPSGLKDYIARLGSGITREQVWSEIAGSSEAQQFASRRPGRMASVQDLLALEGMAFIRQAYLQVLGREADPTGVREYGARMAAGTPKEQVLADLRCDPEGQAFNSRLEGLDDLVRSVQGHGPAAAGAVGGATSLEFLLQQNNEEFVKLAYQTVLRREADPEGLERYRPLLLQGFSKLYVLNALYESPEAREKGIRIPALEPRLRAYRRAQRPGWGGWFWRNVRGIESDMPRDREIRALLALMVDR
jgi:hypothetical protein